MSGNPRQAYALQEFRPRVLAEDWSTDYALGFPWPAQLSDYPSANLRKAYILCMLSELAYEFVPRAELDSSGRMKLIPCERFQQTLRTRNAIAAHVWQSLQDDNPEIRIQVFEGQFFQTISLQTSAVCFVVLRGTRLLYLGDWMVNLNAPLVSAPTEPPRSFHRGFAAEAHKLAERLFPTLGPAIKNNVPVYVTGHSLGGALAGTLFELYRRDTRVACGLPHEGELHFTSAYTFASPRYGDLATMAWAPPPPCHFRPPKDLVPFVPPLSAGYADSPVEFGLRGEVFPKRYSAEKNIYSRIDRPRLLPFGLFRTHSITRMRKSLAQAVDANPDLDLIPRRSPARENALRRM